MKFNKHSKKSTTFQLTINRLGNNRPAIFSVWSAIILLVVAGISTAIPVKAAGGKTAVPTDLGGDECQPVPINFGQSISGRIQGGDCTINNVVQDRYSFDGNAGQQIVLTNNSSFVDTVAALYTEAGQLLEYDDDGGGGTNARIPAQTGYFTLPATGTYIFRASNYANLIGNYMVSLQTNGLICSFGLNPTTLNVPAAGANNNVAVTTRSNCSWQARNSYLISWLSITSGGNYTGNGTVGLTFSPNTTGQSRTGTLVIAGQLVTINQSGTNQQPPNRTAFDFDGDGKADVSVFRPSNGVWYLQRSTAGFTGVSFGLATDQLAPADYDGDGKTDIAVFRSGAWYILRSLDNSFHAVSFGQSGDVPAAGDYDGDGRADAAVFRAGNWYILNSGNGQFRAEQFGIGSDQPIAGDFDGDGKQDLTVFRQGPWYLQRSTAGFTGIQFGSSTDKTVAADYDGDGKTDVAVYRPSNGTWYLLQSTAGFAAAQFGIASDKPVPADYDGDGKADAAVFRAGVWYLQRSQSGFTGVSFGAATDTALPAIY